MGGGGTVAQQFGEGGSREGCGGRIEVDDEAGSRRRGETERRDAMEDRIGARDSSE
jgi:hypothetical protein